MVGGKGKPDRFTASTATSPLGSRGEHGRQQEVPAQQIYVQFGGEVGEVG